MATYMCFQRALLVVLGVVAVVLLPPAATATEHLVGDADGWHPGYNYTNWTMGMEFRVGDSLVFNYAKGKHNVYNVTGVEFQNCTIPENSKVYDSGKDVIALTTEGKKWYICGVAGHCKDGQKVVVNVLPASSSGAALAAFPRMALAAIAAAVAAIAAL